MTITSDTLHWSNITSIFPCYWTGPYYRILPYFHSTFATGATSQQRKLTLPDIWSCPTMKLACVLMLRLISPDLTLLTFPDFWVSNTPRYFNILLQSKTEVPRDIRNSKVWKQDKFRKDWSRHKNTCKPQSGTGPGVRRSTRHLSGVI